MLDLWAMSGQEMWLDWDSPFFYLMELTDFTYIV